MKPHLLVRAEQMRGRGADRALDGSRAAAARRWPAPARASDATARWCRAARRRACRPPPSPARPRRGRWRSRSASALIRRRIGQFGQAGAAQQRAQRRIAERRAIELAEMGVAAMAVEQQRIADVVQRRPVLSGGQRAPGDPGSLINASVQRVLVRPLTSVPKTAPARKPPLQNQQVGQGYTTSCDPEMAGSSADRRGRSASL